MTPGNFVGPLVYKVQDAPRYKPGFVVVVITSIAAGLLALVYRAVCMWESRQRDRDGSSEGFDHAYEDDLTDKKVRCSHGLGKQFADNSFAEPAVQVYSMSGR